jgi:catechol 2,3-dioxygenase-like lactoylglutathione lyase family enzyme/ribosomal protein S18 acetylase RimI-like enzyme
VDIRVLHAVDASAYRDLRLQALSTHPEAFLTTYDDYLSRPLELVTNQLTPDDHHFTVGAFVGDASNQLVGTVTLVRERATKARHIANVFAMFVSPHAQRQGIGRKLLADLIQRTRQLDGVEQLRLSVVKDNNAAMALYQSAGFQVYGTEPNAMKTANRSWDEVHMVLFLASQALPKRQPESSFASMGFSHVTINVSDLERSIAFYVGTLGLKLVHRARQDAYLEWGEAWICLQERPMLPMARPQFGVDHVAFYIPQNELKAAVDALKAANVPMIRGPVERGGGWTVNFLDPDGTQLEFHSGTLGERMKVWK